MTDARQAVRRLQREAPGVPVVIAGCAAEVARKQLAALPGVLRVVEQDHKSRLLDAPPLVLFAEEAAGSATPFPSSPAEAAARAWGNMTYGFRVSIHAPTRGATNS